ncbi:MAG TPA: hypothetical protein PKO06_11815, partial [Candidatus Ozemobacteraceae bacterium]|nr:hypothetical protein [Candidatus Ozemobacteraceae bacterium]
QTPRTIDMKTEDIDFSRFVPPLKILRDRLLLAGGLTTDQVYARTWHNWSVMMSQAMVMFGRECHEVLTLERFMTPSIFKNIADYRDLLTGLPNYIRTAEASLGLIGKILPLTIREVGDNFEVWNWAIGAQRTLGHYHQLAERGLVGRHILARLEGVAAPGEQVGFNGQRLTQAFSAADSTEVLTNTQLAGKTFGFAMAIFSIYMMAQDYQELRGTWNYNSSLENFLGVAGLVLDAAGLLAPLLFPPPYGEIIFTLQMLLLVGKGVVSAYKEWMDTQEMAYQDSHRFLYDADPEFKSFVDNESQWTDQIKSEGMRILQETNRTYRTEPSAFTSGEAVPMQHGLEAAMRQAQVMTYYNRSHPTPPMDEDGLTSMKRMWEAKMSYMQWRPTQRDVDFDADLSRQGFWDRVGTRFNNFWYVVSRDTRERFAPIGRWWNSDNIDANKPRVWYNPDFFLYSKIKRYVDAANPAMVRYLKYRMETAPYHLMPLVEIPVDEWGPIMGDGPAADALKCDVYMCAMKNLRSLDSLIKGMTQEIKNLTDTTKDNLENVRNNTIDRWARPALTALVDLAKAYKEDKNRALDSEIWDKLESLLDFDAPPGEGEKTPDSVVRANRLLIQNHLNMFPYMLGKLEAEAVAAIDGTLNYFLMAKILEDHLGPKVKQETDQLLASIRHTKFRDFLEHKRYLHFGDGWFSEPNIPKKVMEDTVKSLTEADGATITAFKGALQNLIDADDYDWHHRVSDERVMARYRLGIRFCLCRAIDAIKRWKEIQTETNVRIKIPHNANWHYHANDWTSQWFDANDDETRAIFIEEPFCSALFNYPGGPTIADKAGEAADMRALHSDLSHYRRPAKLFERLPAQAP